MTFNEYMKQALVTENKDHFVAGMALSGHRGTRVNHALIGMMTELGELASEFKKLVYYDADEQEFRIKSKEELGDIMWYVALFCHELNFDMDEVLQENLTKLKNRYGRKFTTVLAMERFLERKDKGQK